MSRRRTQLIAFVAFFGIVGVTVVLTTMAAQPAAQVSNLNDPTIPAKVKNHKMKSVCGKVKPDEATCLAKVAVDDNDNVIAEPLASPAYGAGDDAVRYHYSYQLPCTPGGPARAKCAQPASFGPATIAIVNAYSHPNLETDLNTYSARLGIPSCTVANGCLTIVNQSGATSPLPPAAPTNSGWDVEIAMDVQAAHVICQTCKIVLVLTDTNSWSNLAVGVKTAASFRPVSVSNSYGAPTSGGIDSAYNTPGIAMVASSGDRPSDILYPAGLPYVVSATGTALTLNHEGSWGSEKVWNYTDPFSGELIGTGNGCTIYDAPAWQSVLPSWSQTQCGTKRGIGDVSADASGAYITYNGQSITAGGTSLSAPIVAAIYALGNSIPSTTVASSIPYKSMNSTNSRDITVGSACVNNVIKPACSAGPGYDLPSGMGAPKGIGGFMAGVAPAVDAAPPSTPTNLVSTMSGPSLAGYYSYSLTWSPSTDNVDVTGYGIYRDGVLIATSHYPNYRDTIIENAPGKTFNYTVDSHDLLENRSPQSTALTVALPGGSDASPPTAPTSLSATAVSSGRVDLSWAPSTDNIGVAGYSVLRNNQTLFSTTATNFSDTTVNGGQAYTYTVVAKDAAANASPASNPASVTTPATPADTSAPTAPTGLVATAASATRVNLSWTPATDNVGVTNTYVVRNGVTIATLGDVATYVDNAASPSATYSYYVYSSDAAANTGPASSPASVTTPALADTVPPSVPTSFTATLATANQANLVWSASSDNVGVTGYSIYRNGALLATTTATSYGDVTLTAGQTYSYAVEAIDAAGNRSAKSASASVTTQSTQTNLSGKVTSNGAAISGASVKLSNGRSTTTDRNGNYSLTGVANGTYTLTVSKRKYLTSSQSVLLQGGNGVINVVLSR